MENMQTQELISALADGHLQGDAFARGVALVASDATAREAWQTYHLIGDVLRSGELGVASMQPAFLERLQSRLREEPPLALPAARGEPMNAGRSGRAANDSSFRWKLVAGFASVAAVSAIVWSLGGALPGNPGAAQLAKAAPNGAVLAASERGVMIRDARLDELLAAHRQLGGATTLQMSGGFVRNATYEGAAR